MKPSLAPAKIWFMALRPKTLTAAVGPMLIATAMAYADNLGHALTAAVCLFTALMLQIGTNIANDYYDFIKGADTESRIGPTRVTQAGLLPPPTVKMAFILCFVLAALGWLYLIERAGWPMLILSITSILSGIFYTAGSKALGYIGLGDVFVFIFFGPVAVAGMYYAQALQLTPAALLAGIGPGLIAVAILTINNLRDIDSDRQSNKRTLAVRFGHRFARFEYLSCIIGAALIPAAIYLFANGPAQILGASLSCLLALPMINTVFHGQDGPNLNHTLAQTGALLLIYSVTFALGWILAV